MFHISIPEFAFSFFVSPYHRPVADKSIKVIDSKQICLNLENKSILKLKVKSFFNVFKKNLISFFYF